MTNVHTNFCFIEENREAYDRCHEILGLPDDVHWSKLTVEFGSDQFGEVTLKLIPTGEQVAALAQLAILRVQDNCVKDDAGYAHSDPLPDAEIPAGGFGLSEM